MKWNGSLDMSYTGLGFSASTGSVYSKHQIDDISIVKYTAADTEAPVIALNGSPSMTIGQHTSFIDPGYTVTDNVDLNVPVTVVGAVYSNTLGTYTLTYSATDIAGNAAVPVIRTVVVTSPEVPVDMESPVITLIGGEQIVIEQGTTFVDPGYTVQDNMDTNLLPTVTGMVDLNTPGTYILRYNVTDSSGNEAIEVTRTVVVVDPDEILVTLEPGEDGIDIEDIISFLHAGGDLSGDDIIQSEEIRYLLSLIVPINMPLVD